MASVEPEGAKEELETLRDYNVVFEGDKVKAFLEWAREHAERLYPDVGMRSYVVPPLFVYKHASRYDPAAGADVLQETQKSSPKGEKAHSIVAYSFSMLSPRLARPLFLISGLEYDNLLKWVRHHPHLAPPLPDAVENRGDIDIMLIHPCHGVVFIQVKAVGDNAQSKTQAEVQKRIVLGARQLHKDANILRWVMQDLPAEAAACHVTRVVALPNLARQETASFWPPPDLDPSSEEAKNVEGVLFLCKDDVMTLDAIATAEADADVTSLLTWWQQNVAGVEAPLSPAFMKDLVSRYVGMLSAVEVYTGNNLRKEVRMTSDAVDVLGTMFRRILLNEQQLKILATPCPRRYLSGPPGSGKTVLIMLKARQHVQQGGHVVVINMYRGAAGRAIGHFIRDGVARFRVPPQGKEGRKVKGKSKARKKKTEEHAAPTTAADVTPLAPRKRIDTPPFGGVRGRQLEAASSRSQSLTSARSKPPLTSSPGPQRQRQRQDSEKKGRRDGNSPVPREGIDSPTPTRSVGSPSPTGARRSLPAPPCREDLEVDLSDHVHCLDVDIGPPAFDAARFQADIRALLPPDVTGSDVMFVVDEIYVREYWSGVLERLDLGFPGCQIWCAGLYSRNPQGFQQEDLYHVMRCPPLVQKVLWAVDWVEERRTRYRRAVDAAQGVYTPGLSPLAVRHQDHVQVSVTECEECAAELATLLVEGLGILRAACTTSCPTNCNSANTTSSRRSARAFFTSSSSSSSVFGRSSDSAERNMSSTSSSFDSDFADSGRPCPSEDDQNECDAGEDNSVCRQTSYLILEQAQREVKKNVWRSAAASPVLFGNGSVHSGGSNIVNDSYPSCLQTSVCSASPHSFLCACLTPVKMICNSSESALISSYETTETQHHLSLVTSAGLNNAAVDTYSSCSESEIVRSDISSSSVAVNHDPASSHAFGSSPSPTAYFNSAKVNAPTTTLAPTASFTSAKENAPTSSPAPTASFICVKSNAFTTTAVYTASYSSAKSNTFTTIETHTASVTPAKENAPKTTAPTTRTATTTSLTSAKENTPTTRPAPTASLISAKENASTTSPTHTASFTPAKENAPKTSTAPKTSPTPTTSFKSAKENATATSPAPTESFTSAKESTFTTSPTSSFTSSARPTNRGSSSYPLRVTPSDVVVLVNLPRALYEPDERGFLDTTLQDFCLYMAYLDSCPLVRALRAAGVPVRVVRQLPCHDLYDLKDRKDESMLAVWAYAYQGLENKVVIYLPADTPWRRDPYSREIPTPGLRSTPREAPKPWAPVTALTAPAKEGRGFYADGPLPPPDAPPFDDHASVGGDYRYTAGCHHYRINSTRDSRSESGFHESESAAGQATPGGGGLEGAPELGSFWDSDLAPTGSGLGRRVLNLPDYWWQERDVSERYSNWDKSGLFVAASRCLSQLILLVP